MHHQQYKDQGHRPALEGWVVWVSEISTWEMFHENGCSSFAEHEQSKHGRAMYDVTGEHNVTPLPPKHVRFCAHKNWSWQKAPDSVKNQSLRATANLSWLFILLIYRFLPHFPILKGIPGWLTASNITQRYSYLKQIKILKPHTNGKTKKNYKQVEQQMMISKLKVYLSIFVLTWHLKDASDGAKRAYQGGHSRDKGQPANKPSS